MSRVEGGARLLREVSVAFRWHPGFAVSQKRRNVAALHEAAAAQGLGPLLEVSSKSEDALGRGLSAFALRLPVAGGEAAVESAFQGSKVFERGGPFAELIGGGQRRRRRTPEAPYGFWAPSLAPPLSVHRAAAPQSKPPLYAPVSTEATILSTSGA